MNRDHRNLHRPSTAFRTTVRRMGGAGREIGIAAQRCVLVPMVVLLTCLSPGLANAQRGITPEHKVKVAYLYNFIRYVQWPENAFDNNEAPFVIGILQNDTHGNLLDQIARRKLARGRKIVIRRFKAVSQIANCHLVFLSSSIGSAAEAQAIARTELQKALLICDSVTSPQPGVPIRFFRDPDGTIGLKINIDAMQRRDLRADAKLLNIALVVRG